MSLSVRALPWNVFRPVPIPVMVAGLYGGIQAMLLYYFSTYAASEAARGWPLLFGTLWLGTEGQPAVGGALTTANVIVAVFLWISYRIGRRSYPGSLRVRQAAYLAAVGLLASLQWACVFLTRSLPTWVLTQIHP
jgi:hypothetical protein